MRSERIPPGSMIVYYESDEERDERRRLAAEEARRTIRVTPGQLKFLKQQTKGQGQ